MEVIVIQGENYGKVKKESPSLSDNIRYFLKLLCISTVCIFISIAEYLKAIFYYVFTKKPKLIKGQLALITGGEKLIPEFLLFGGSHGIGRSIAFRMAKEGCNIAIANRNLSEGQKVACEINKIYGVIANAFQVDVSKQEEVQKLKENVEMTMGNVDILVNNAGLLSFKASLLESTPQQIQNMIDTNLTAYFWTSRAFLGGMIQRKRGHIVSVSSLSAKLTICRAVPYCATKYGNDGFMSALYDDLCYDGHDEYIKLTTAYPTFVDTSEKFAATMDNYIKTLRYGPNYIADLIVDGMLMDRREFTVPSSARLMTLSNLLPDKALKKAKLAMMDDKMRSQFEEMRKRF